LNAAPDCPHATLVFFFFNPKWSLETSCSPLLSESGFTGFKDLQDFFPPPIQADFLNAVPDCPHATRIFFFFNQPRDRWMVAKAGQRP
jgi:hypothetical protein